MLLLIFPEQEAKLHNQAKQVFRENTTLYEKVVFSNSSEQNTSCKKRSVLRDAHVFLVRLFYGRNRHVVAAISQIL